MQFAKLESLLPMDGVGEPLRLTTADGVAFTVVSRNAGNGKQIVVRPQVSGSLNESFAFNMEDVITKEKPEAHRALRRSPARLPEKQYRQQQADYVGRTHLQTLRHLRLPL